MEVPKGFKERARERGQIVGCGLQEAGFAASQGEPLSIRGLPRDLGVEEMEGPGALEASAGKADLVNEVDLA